MLGGVAGSRISPTSRSISSQVESPRATASAARSSSSLLKSTSLAGSSESYNKPDADDRPSAMAWNASQSWLATVCSPGSWALVWAIARAEPSRDFAKLRAMACHIARPSLLATQCWVSPHATSVGRPPSKVRGDDVTASILAPRPE